ncbi:class I SAM-dependent methyltransferase [Streptomyces acidicola]|uniref:Class I SAM-dependent methyltransferase n=1 Tax=Streptomyces acidicola TaxID=2596892 RepID=A0A5N8X352_9ACTN|nr:class I SAM-dependent methyltransferase [Streptomyces acidicola]MPY54010.1 class I SAM-dependent methyltransferase [Streptomyces acidicola]
MISPEGADMARLFDSLGMDYEHAFAGRKQAQIDAVEELSCRLAPGSRVLDVGCATGRPTTEQLCARGLDVTGIDVSEVMLDHARRQVPQARLVLADIFCDTADLGVYDAVVCLFCLVNLPEPHFVEGLRRLAARTVPGGTVLVAVPEFQGIEEVPFLDLTYRPVRCLREDVHRYAQSADLEVERVEAHIEPAPDGQDSPGRSLFLWARTPA